MRGDRVFKRNYFMRNHVPVYWIVDIEAALVEEWKPGEERPRIITDRLEWRPDGAAEPFILELADLFAGTEPEPDTEKA